VRGSSVMTVFVSVGRSAEGAADIALLSQHAGR
jgi:hypothetical protein